MKQTIKLIQSEIPLYPSTHHYLASKLNFPSHYGHNLDALWDCLTGEIELPLTIVWVNDTLNDTNDSKIEDNEYSTFISLFKEAAEEVNGLCFQYVNQSAETDLSS